MKLGLRLAWLFGGAALGACGFPRPADVIGDASPMVDAPGTGIDGSVPTPKCDPTASFGTIAQVLGVTISGIREATFAPRLSSDELTIYFAGTDDNNAARLYMAQRSNRSDAFSPPTPMSELNGPSMNNSVDADATTSADGLTVFFESGRSSNLFQIYTATRGSALSLFGMPTPATVNATPATEELDPFLTSDGEELWFASGRSTGLKIFRATKVGGVFGSPAVVPELNGNDGNYYPTLSSDKLTLYFSSTRTSSQSNSDIWTSHRSSTSDPFPAPRAVDELDLPFNSGGLRFFPPTNPGWLSADNCRLYGASDAGLFVAMRQP